MHTRRSGNSVRNSVCRMHLAHLLIGIIVMRLGAAVAILQVMILSYQKFCSTPLAPT